MAEPRIVVLLLDTDASAIEGIRAALEPSQGFQLVLATGLSQGLERFKRGDIDLILLSLRLPDGSGQAVLEKTLAAAGQTPVIVLGEEDSPGLGLQLVRAGVQDYLVKSRLTAPALVRCVRHAVERHRHVQRLLESSRPTADLGKVITFYGVKGGVGATTTVLNTAAALGQKGNRVIAAEILPSLGFSVQLKRPRATGAGELLSRAPGAIDTREVERQLTLMPFGFRVLFGTGSGTSQPVHPEQIGALLDAATELADLVLIDLPCQTSRLHAPVLAKSDYCLLVLEPDALCAEYGEVAVTLLEQWGVNPAAIGMAVVNRSALASSIPPRELKARLSCEIVGMIPAAGEGCVMAFNAAKPLVLLQPESRYSAAISAFAENLAMSPVRAISF